jgi:hypothetical protein
VCARASVCVGACVVRTPLRVCLCTRLSVCARVHALSRGCVFSTCVCARALRPCSLHDGRPETRGQTHVIWRLSSAAGVTWTSRTTSVQWDWRWGHTSVIDAAGAIYVIGGHSGSVFLRDVLVSTDGGADRTRGGCFRGYYG